MTLKSGWIGEVKGIQNWPSIFYTNIANLLSLTQPDFVKRHESEYKQGKAYRYFSCEFVMKIYINELNKETPVCILKCKVIPSQRINSKPYDVWAVVQKNKPNEPGGYIHSAYCTWTAGILGHCNHVTGMLCRIENAVQAGLTTPSKTSVLCTWNIPKGQRVDTTVKPVRDLVFEKSVYTKPKSKSVILANDKKEYLDFFPAVKNQEKLKDKENLENSLFTILEKDIPAPFVLSMKSKITVKNSSMDPQTPPVDPPETVKQLRNKYTYNESNILLQNVVEFTRSLNVSKNQIEHLTNLTKEQASSELWLEQRWDRMTASNFHRICSRMNTLTKKPDENPNNLLRSLSYSRPFESEETKYGKSMEPHAIQKFISENKRLNKNLNVSESGLVLMEENPFKGASPDSNVDCSCCGSGLFEVRCPSSIKREKPSLENPSFLTLGENDKVTLKQSHPFFYQVHQQMGVTGKNH